MYNLVGFKVGVTRVFTEEGHSIPITVIHIKENKIVRIKNCEENECYIVQCTIENKKKKLNKSKIGYFSKNGINFGSGLWSFKTKDISILEENKSINIDFLKNTNKVDITGISKGKGFAGTIKRWNFHSQDATHGNSLSHRVPGSIGQNQTPGRVYKGKKMSGHLGNKKTTIQNLAIISIDKENELLLVKGFTPGIKGSILVVKPAIKI